MIQLSEREKLFIRVIFTAAIAHDLEQSPMSWNFQALEAHAVEMGDVIFNQFMASAEAIAFPPSLRQLIEFSEAWATLSYSERERTLAEAVAIGDYEPAQIEYLFVEVLGKGGQP